MNPLYHADYANLRHQELLSEGVQLRRRSALRHLAKTARLGRRADALTRRAAEHVERNHS